LDSAPVPKHLASVVFLEPSVVSPAELLPDALDAVAPATPITLVLGGPGVTRVRKYLGPQSVQKAWSDPIGTTVVALTSVARNCYDPQNHDYAEIGFRRGRFVTPASGDDSLGEVAVMHANPFADIDPEQFVRAILRMFGRSASAQYGYVHCATNIHVLGIEGSVLAGNPWIPETIEHTNDRFNLTYPMRSQAGEKVLGAHWGVILGEKLLEQLGGRECVTAEAPVHRVRHLENGAAFLQLTAEPQPLSAAEMLHALPKFEAYLEPISLPIGPYFRRKIPLMG
jgi:hypothetical protein